jgi:DNA-binding NtrC family response regulator
MMGKVRVLLVDDEEDFTAALSERMEERGLDVDVSDNGPDAIEKVRGKGFDAVVLDLAMPGMDGIETLKRLLGENPDLQVILLTGRATVRDGVNAMSAGAMEFLEKPVELDLLMTKIQEAQVNRVLLMEKRAEEAITDILQKKGW